MRIPIHYGRGQIEIGIPDGIDVTVIRKPPMPLIADPGSAIKSALDAPLGSPRLDVAAANASSACIAICDVTRPVPNHLFLRPLIQRLIAAGIPASGITVLVATGLHRPNEGAELAELIGDRWVMGNVRIANHFARNDADHIRLGKTRTRGTVVRIDRRFVEADVRIATGLVEPHFMAGYSGGRKVIAPGLAHAETITTFHCARFMADPAATNCNLDGNPLHEEQLEIIQMLGGAYALNTIIDEHRNLSFVNFGEIVASHDDAVSHVRSFCEVDVPRRFTTVVTTAAGYPLDKTYYQTIKGMVGATNILEPDGDLIIASECSEGMGSAEFIAAQQRLVQSGPDAFLAEILAKSHADIDEWQSQKQIESMNAGRIFLYSGRLPPSDHARTGVTVVESVDAALHASLARHTEPSLAVIPEGPYVIPFYRPAACL